LLAISLNIEDVEDLLLQIVIVAYNSADVLRDCLASIASSNIGGRYEITVFDNASLESCRILCETRLNEPLHIVESPVNLGFGRANNAAVKLSQSKFILLLNPDAVVDPAAISSALDILSRDSSVGIVGGSLFSPDGHPEPSARFSPTVWSLFAQKIGLNAYFGNGERSDLHWSRAALVNCDWVPGCFYLFRRTLLKEVDLFDPRYFLYYEEVDHCKRVREFGYKVVCSPDVKVKHIGGASAKTVAVITQNGRQISPLQIESELLFLRKHFGLIGLLCHVAFTVVACFVVFGKALIKRKNLARVTSAFRDLKLMIKVCFLTNFGYKPIH
jgi:N-acetylglucosaminyl-diphospho-decaprenol L-rhamnosyltransferase